MLRKYHYLYVEDDPFSREIMRTLMLDVIGVGSLVIFDSSEDFMAHLRALDTAPDIILLDVHIEPHDGFEVLKMLRADPDFRDRMIIAVTASVMPGEIRRLQAGGFNGALAKPLDMFTFGDLISRIEAGEEIWQLG